MRRILKVCTDKAKILEAMNNFLPMTSHYSRSLGSDGVGLGVHWKIAGMRVRQALMEEIWKESGIKMAAHYGESTWGRGRSNRVYNWRMIKSRFGETKVVSRAGYPMYSDKPAIEYAQRMYASDIEAISETLRSGGADPLGAARTVKKQQQAEGRW